MEQVEIEVTNMDPAAVPADPSGLASSSPAPAPGAQAGQPGQIPAPAGPDPNAGGIFSRANIRQAFELAFNMGLAPRLGVLWKLTDQELERLADVWSEFLAGLFPSIAAATEGGAGGLITVNATIFGPRLALHFMMRAMQTNQPPTMPPAVPQPDAPPAPGMPAADYPPGV